MWTNRGKRSEGFDIKYITDAWNNEENDTLTEIAQEVANSYKEEIGNDKTQTAWILIIKKESHWFDKKLTD